jgi:hypothetical protein
MKSLNYFALIVFAVAILIISCKKDESATSSTIDMLTSKSWKAISVKMGSTEYLQNCNKDDITTYSKDGTVFTTIGSIACSAGETNQSGTWRLEDDGKTIVISVAGQSFTSYSIEITQNKLTLEYSDFIFIYVPA